MHVGSSSSPLEAQADQACGDDFSVRGEASHDLYMWRGGEQLLYEWIPPLHLMYESSILLHNHNGKQRETSCTQIYVTDDEESMEEEETKTEMEEGEIVREESETAIDEEGQQQHHLPSVLEHSQSSESDER